MNAVIYWFRNDLRLNDNPAFAQALHRASQTAAKMLVVYIHDPKQHVQTPWGFERMGEHRKAFLAERLNDLKLQLALLGIELTELQGSPKDALSAFAKAQNTTQIYCEDLAAPEEQADVEDLKATGLDVKTLWQSSLLEPADLPFDVQNLPAVFTAFRNKVEKQNIKPRPVLQISENLPESVAEKHLKHYFSGDFALTYKLTRNQPMNWSPDEHFSTKFSPWLACGAISAPMIYAELKHFEAKRGANDSTYWIWFELLWRDYFRFLHLQHGKKLYIKQGLGSFELATVSNNKQGLVRWCEGRTGEPFVDAGMRELAATGWLSNRMRQMVASYLIYDLGGDWRAGAAWFESQLIDYDVYSNQGNWLYIAGRGTDPRGGRRFNPQMQAQQHDPEGVYRRFWGES
ncbi:MAG: FAD-binding domain-containing protein [Burkholderiaceae bacterium]